MMTRRTLRIASAALIPLIALGVARAWWVKGHGSIAEAAAAGLPDDVPEFFRHGGSWFSHLAGDPDRWKNPSARYLRAAASPDHYINFEDLKGHALPADRYKYATLLTRLDVSPEKAGMLPYALMENYERLACAFYDLRAEPDNPAIRAKCLVYAGVLSHFTGDVAMPLHVTHYYDGRPDAAGKFSQRGIHAKIDGFPETHGITPAQIAQGLQARKIDDVWSHVLATIDESYQQIERCYALDAAGAFDAPTAESREFILQRCRVGAQLTMDLWYSAWLRSADMPPHY